MRPLAGRAGALAGLAGAIALLAAHALLYDCVVDDAFIIFRYAQNFMEGHGLVYNLGDPVEGYTSFSWTVLLAAVLSVWPDPLVVANTLGITAGAVCLGLVWWFCRRLFGDARWACLPPLLLALDRTFAGWCTGGLATKLFTTLIFAAAARALVEREEPDARRPVAGLLFGLAALTRPEAFVFGGIVGLWWLGLALRRSLPWRRVFGLAIGFAVVVGPHLWWRHSFYDAWLPNTFYAKVGGLYWQKGAPYVWLFLSNQHVVPIALALAIVALVRNPIVAPRRAAIPLGLTFVAVQLAYVTYLGGDPYEFRFLDVTLPWLAIAATTGALFLARHAAVPRWVTGAAIALLVVNQALPTLRSPLLLGSNAVERTYLSTTWLSGLDIETLEVQQVQEDEEALVAWLLEHQRPGDSLAIGAAGLIPFRTRLPTLDLHGLNDRRVARQPLVVRGWPGHEKHADEDYVQSKKPTFIVRSLDGSLGNAHECVNVKRMPICVMVRAADNLVFGFETTRDVTDFKRELRRRGAQVLN